MRDQKTTTLPVGKIALGAIGVAWTFAAGFLGSEVRDRWFPPTAKVELTSVSLRPGFSFRDWLAGVREWDERTFAPVPPNKRTEYPEEQLMRKGLGVYATMTITGFKGDRLIASALVLREGNVVPGPPAFVFFRQPRANEETITANIWVPQPWQPGCYNVEAQVRESKEYSPIVDTKESDKFRVDSKGNARLIGC